MILKDLKLIIENAESNYESYFRNPYEVVLSENFKRNYEKVTNASISFYENTSIAVTTRGLKIIIPNQWFVIASFFIEFYSALLEYKNLIKDVGISQKDLPELKNASEIPEAIQQSIDSYFSQPNQEKNKEFFIKFLTDYNWWSGQKTLDRNDYFYSPILDTAKLVHATQSYVAEICKEMTPDLASILQNNHVLNNQLLNPDIPRLVIFYGAPGTGKSHTIKEKLKSVPKGNIETVTFHPDYDYTSFVGGYRPITEKDSNDDESIKYRFVPQVFTNIYVKAWQNPDEPFYLVIEEINRGNCAEIFGDIFQLLDQNQNYTVTPSNELKAYLVNEFSETHEGIINGLKMPNNLSILATMNTSDQSLFPMDSAFKRRWDWEYIPINYDESNNPSSEFIVEFDDKTYFSWLDFIEKVNDKIKNNHNLGMDKCIGNYFINPTDNIISLKTFINKAIFYLWNDVFKDEFGDESIFGEGVSYEDFFPIEKNGAQMVKALLETLDFKLSNGKYMVSNEDTN